MTYINLWPVGMCDVCDMTHSFLIHTVAHIVPDPHTVTACRQLHVTYIK